MKLIKVLTPVLLSSFLAFPAFAAEDQAAQMQAQSAQMDQQQASAANQNEQLAAGNEAAANQAQGEKDKSEHKGKARKAKCTKCKHRMHKKAHSMQGEETGMNQGQQQPAADAHGQQQAQEQAPNQNS